MAFLRSSAAISRCVCDGTSLVTWLVLYYVLFGVPFQPLGINPEKSIVICYPYPDAWGHNYAKLMVMLHFLVYYAIPLVVIAAFYVLIALHLMYSASVPGEMQGAVRQVSQ